MTDYKKDFPLLAESDIAYLDNAATEQRPACVLDAEREFYERWNANPLRGLYELGVEATEQYEHARERSMSMQESASHSLYMRRVREKSFLPEIRPRASTWWRTAMRCPG